MTKERYDMEDLIRVMAALRNPDGGCPWDLEQDFKSIAPHTIEEAYEVADAIDRQDMQALREELGDLLFQPVYHAQMASEAGLFTLHDVIHDITAKMISRHPHVFGDGEAKTAQDVNRIWDERKAAEGKKETKSVLDGVTRGLPSLLRAQKLQKKAASVGFEWTDIKDILAKLDEEVAELREAIAHGTKVQQQDELGDVIFVLANIGRHLGIDSEEATRQCNAKFERRFKGIENDFAERGLDLKSGSLAEKTESWDLQKKKERS